MCLVHCLINPIRKLRRDRFHLSQRTWGDLLLGKGVSFLRNRDVDVTNEPKILSLPFHPSVHKDCNKAWELISAKLTSLILSRSAGEASGTALLGLLELIPSPGNTISLGQVRVAKNTSTERDAKNPKPSMPNSPSRQS
ncbi:hypothetical protein YC2023_078864 [Brassica napus]